VALIPEISPGLVAQPDEAISLKPLDMPVDGRVLARLHWMLSRFVSKLFFL
jgi:hypothetical protein